jgi:hypothetical protein
MSRVAIVLFLAALLACREAPPPRGERDEGRVKQVLARALTLSKDPQASPDEVRNLFQEAILAAEGTPAAPEAALAFDLWRETQIRKQAPPEGRR